MMLEGLKSLARSSLRRTPVRLRVRAMEKKAMAAVIARRGCSMVWPRRAEAVGDAGAEGKDVYGGEWPAAAGWRTGTSGIVEGSRGLRRSGCRGRFGGLAGGGGFAAGLGDDAVEQEAGGSGRGDFSISIQAAPRWASANMAVQLGQPATWRSKVAWSAAERTPSSASASMASHCAQC